MRQRQLDVNAHDTDSGQAHHMFSRFLNLRIFFTKFSLFCFSTRYKFSIEIIDIPIQMFIRTRHFADKIL